ncbi:N-acetyltransferase [Metabacillus halosaccharovorans]|uniref:N-acetyltransferase n=1 Tax=Metabacillus halosaccharovorans TaxID=930124 RepID=UPI001C1FB5DE|nr:N-acetyltransferase [Metabacillus halosaccharovorans]MBU7595143.1 N-acetyltransferase [Metabacillus halosaccharovorans]
MIRKYKRTDIDTLVDIWYKGSLQSHSFIEPNYWRSQMSEMKEKYIPMSETYVKIHQSRVIGFISMLDNYLAALFVDVSFQNNGAGRELLHFIQDQREVIELKVYKDNSSALRFYLNNGFFIKEELTDEQTDMPEFLMEWNKN